MKASQAVFAANEQVDAVVIALLASVLLLVLLILPGTPGEMLW